MILILYYYGLAILVVKNKIAVFLFQDRIAQPKRTVWSSTYSKLSYLVESVV